MGTSASSNGPGAGVSLDPAWLDDIDIPNQEKTNEIENTLQELSPKGRFSGARRNLGEYVRSGKRESARRALGHYSKTGMGGAQNVARRMRISTRTAANFFGVLHSLRDDHAFALGRELQLLREQGADASEIIKAIVYHTCPVGGSIDEISCIDSEASAISIFLEKNPNADVCNLSEDQIWELTAIFLGNEIFSRVQMDIGQAFEKQDVSSYERIARLNEMCEYIQSEISVQMNDLRSAADHYVDLNLLFHDIIRNTFYVFEEEV